MGPGTGTPATVGSFRSDIDSGRSSCNTVARVSEISARSDSSFEDAVNSGLARANTTLRNVKSAWIKEQSVDVENGKIVGVPRQHAGHLRPRVAGTSGHVI